MKHLYGLALALVLVGAGCAPTKPVQPVTPQPQLEVTGEANEPGLVVEQVELLADGFYKLDAMKSSIKWQASKLKSGHFGTVTAREGYVRVDKGVATEGSALVDMDTLKDLDLEGAFLKQLENHLRSADFFDIEQYPTASFVLKSIEPVSGIDGANYRVDGQMTIKNITNDLSFPATLKEFDGGLRLSGRATIDRTLYDIKFGSGKFFQDLGDSLIDDNFHLDLDLMFLVGAQAPEQAGDGDEVKGS